jgi:hypothetical protein
VGDAAPRGDVRNTGWRNALVAAASGRGWPAGSPRRRPGEGVRYTGRRGCPGFVDDVAALRWFRTNDYGKTAHIVITHAGVTLTPADVDMLKRRVIF